jgi:D-arabinose 1-dehydrogenase-like Zn-dependent alcohol dehydrogenase
MGAVGTGVTRWQVGDRVSVGFHGGHCFACDPCREGDFTSCEHALTHEVAYGSLLQERRRALHVRLVEALETLAPDRMAEQVDRLAHHALRGEVWD